MPSTAVPVPRPDRTHGPRRTARRPAAIAAPALAVALALGACSSGSSDGDDGPGGTAGGAAAPDGPAGGVPAGDAAGGTDNRLLRSGTTYAVTDGLIVDYGPTGAHYNVDFGIADAPYRTDILLQPDVLFGGTITVPIFPADDATVEFDVELYSPGADAFRGGTFEFSSAAGDDFEDGSAALAGRALFINATLYPDADGDGESDAEGIVATGGRISVQPSGQGFAMAIDVTLADGTRLTGGYAGAALYADQTD